MQECVVDALHLVSHVLDDLVVTPAVRVTSCLESLGESAVTEPSVCGDECGEFPTLFIQFNRVLRPALSSWYERAPDMLA